MNFVEMATRADILGALARLQDNPPANPVKPSSWLDRNEGDVLLLLGSKGVRMTADLIGIQEERLGDWRYRRRKRKEKRKALGRTLT